MTTFPKPPKSQPKKRVPIARKREGKTRPGRLQGDALAALRSECFYRDKGRCCDCMRPVQLNGDAVWGMGMHMAHIKAKRMGGDSLQNVRTLCPECHRKSHNAGGKPVPSKMECEL